MPEDLNYVRLRYSQISAGTDEIAASVTAPVSLKAILILLRNMLIVTDGPDYLIKSRIRIDVYKDSSLLHPNTDNR